MLDNLLPGVTNPKEGKEEKPGASQEDTDRQQTKITACNQAAAIIAASRLARRTESRQK
jgi:hypothetical protein